MRSFRMGGLLGTGGFGEVYAATMMDDDGSRRPVAVKLLHDNTVTEGARRRLIDEYRLLRELSHPNILRCYALTRVASRPALITELVDGASLAACISAEDIPFRVVVEVMGAIAEALHAAYTHILPGRGALELVHRDVKASNIQVAWDGRVVLLDFGIARSDALDRAAQTAPGRFVGAYPYMAPERFRRGPSNPSSDIFALGVTAYKALTKRLLAHDSWGSQVLAVRTAASWSAYVEPRLAAGGRLAQVPRLRALICDMLEFDPRARPTAADVVARCQALAESLAGPDRKEWAQARTWPIESEAGPLSGRILGEDPHQFETTDVVFTGSTTNVLVEPAPAPPPAPRPESVVRGRAVAAFGCTAAFLALVGGVGGLVGVGLLAQGISQLEVAEGPVALSNPEPTDTVTVSPEALEVRSPPPDDPTPSPVPPPAPTPMPPVSKNSNPKPRVEPPQEQSRQPPVARAVPVPRAMETATTIEPPTPTHGRVRLVGDAPSVWLVRQGGPARGKREQIALQTASWTEVSAGRYAVWSRWLDGSTSQPVDLEVTVGATSELRCSDVMELCSVEQGNR